jgi:23S rRNA (cytosine1962-C5)-methyltransferase
MTSEADPIAIPTVELKIERRSSHPWIFQKMVERPAARIAPGTVVDIRERGGQWVGRGFYNGHSRIALRLLTTDPNEAIDAAFFKRKLADAVSLRRELLDLDSVTNAYRLVHSEADGLSGLIVDRYGDTVVLEFFSAGMFKQRGAIIEALNEHFTNAKYYWFAEEHVGKQESFDCRAPEPPEPGVIQEHGLNFRVAPGSKHKTGFFVDQRDNRKRIAAFCGGKRMLDICCNTGGFAVYAKALGGASEVVGIDLDEQALELARGNAKLNNAAIRYVQADLFSWLRDVIPNQEKFDVVVLDPAKLTRDRESVDLALKKYCDMNRLAMHVVKPGGVLLSCSCTGLVREEEFLESMRRAAWQAQRSLQIFHVGGAGPDHPFLLSVPEGRYLKAVFARVF